MKITKIEVSNFRGFPGPAVYDFEFGGAKNLFIYGENGSGKSSLFRALQEFFDARKAVKPFSDFKNDRDPSLREGRVSVHFDNGSVQTWSHGAERPLGSPPASQTALQVGCFDYKSLLETNFSQKGDDVNLFHIAVDHLVPHLEVKIEGGSRRIRDLWQSVSLPKNHHEQNLHRCERTLKRFNDAFEPVVAPLLAKSTELLSQFFDSNLLLDADYRKVRYDRLGRRFTDTELVLSVRRGGAELLSHHNVLNEARLSAIGLVIYLAGLLISVPTTSAFPKLLVLDDVLIGLDMSNRIPVLRVIATHFADWQVILLTHDHVWYEMVQVEIEEDWLAYELWLAGDGLTPIHRKRDSGPDFFLSRAKQHLAANDYRAAGVYTRAAFETKVKGYCDRRSVAVAYSKDPRNLKIENAWQAAKEKGITIAQKSGDSSREPKLRALFHSVDLAKKVVLNPLSHSTSQPLTKPEIGDAIDAVAALTFE